jgi:hypothetical protein
MAKSWSLSITVPAGTTPEMMRIIVRDASVNGTETQFVKHVKSLALEAIMGEHHGSTTHPETPVGFAVSASGDDKGFALSVGHTKG